MSGFASAGDMAARNASFTELVAGRAYAYTAEGDPNTGVIIGDRGVMVVDTQATPLMAGDVIAKIRTVTDLPVTHILLSHYHAVRVFGASAYGAHTILASAATHALIAERGEADKASEIARFPRLFAGVETIPPGLVWPDLVFDGRIRLDLGNCPVEIWQPGRGHTAGDTVAWLPDHGVLFAGDLVEWKTACYAGDAYLSDWPGTLDRLAELEARALVPGRGDALVGREQVDAGIAATRAFVTDLFQTTRRFAVNGRPLGDVYREVMRELEPRYGNWHIFRHCMPFNVSRAYDEALGIIHPRIWTAERDLEMWAALEGA
ncbi:MBL fold metallo-hydrolase [Thermaurantiacus sp.]